MPGAGQDSAAARPLSDAPNNAPTSASAVGRAADASVNGGITSTQQGTTSLPNIVTFVSSNRTNTGRSLEATRTGTGRSLEATRTGTGRSLEATRTGTGRSLEVTRSDGAPRRSLSYALRPDAEVYYDSRAGTRREWKRRHRTLMDYYGNNPQLLPQLPFTWHHGWKRWRLFLFAIIVFIDGSIVPILLYYTMRYAGHVAGWIIFAVVTTIWGGPTYVELAIRTLRLMKKERFYRPLGTDSRWCFDILNWTSVITITAVTALFIVGSAPHEVWLRVLCMPAPAILYCIGGVLALITLFHLMNWPAPFRLSSTGKGEKVLPGVYYFIEDVVAVNAGAGRPFREALAARYHASPHFRTMLLVQSLFWSIPALVLAAALTVVALLHPIPATVAYGICWAVPFIWCAIWGAVTVVWCKRSLVRERLEWEQEHPTEKLEATSSEPLAAV